MSTLLLFFLMFSSVSTFALASPATLPNAVDTLSNSGYLSMALTLQITSKTLDLESKTVTIFAPSDLAFERSGQMSLLQLQYHIAPVKLSQDDINHLHVGSRIPTLFSNHSLTITASDYNASFSVNGVLVQDAPLYDEVYLAMYGMDDFFNSSFHANTTSNSFSAQEASLDSTTASMHKNFSQFEVEVDGFDVHVFGQASDCLISKGYTIMGSFLGLQLTGLKDDETRLTIFAPVDAAVEAYFRNFTDYFVFRRHVVPRLLSWQDLVRLGDGAMLPTFSRSFSITVAWSGDVLVLNGVPVIFPDMFTSDCLVLHGLSGMLVSPVNQEIIGDSFSELDAEDYLNPPDNV